MRDGWWVYLFTDLQRPLAQWLCLLVLAPLPIEHGQVVQGGGHLGEARDGALGRPRRGCDLAPQPAMQVAIRSSGHCPYSCNLSDPAVAYRRANSSTANRQYCSCHKHAMWPRAVKPQASGAAGGDGPCATYCRVVFSQGLLTDGQGVIQQVGGFLVLVLVPEHKKQ